MVSAGLQRHIEGRSGGAVTGGFEGDHLGVRPARSGVAPSAHLGSVGGDHHRSHPRVGVRSDPTGCRDRRSHHLAVDAFHPIPLRMGERARPTATRLLPSGLSPSAPEFHRSQPLTGVAGFHRRSGIAPCPEGGLSESVYSGRELGSEGQVARRSIS